MAVLPFDPRARPSFSSSSSDGAVGVLDDPWLVEPVAGLLEPGEDAPEVARREAAEEAGLEPWTWSRPAPISRAPAAAPRPARCSSAAEAQHAPRIFGHRRGRGHQGARRSARNGARMAVRRPHPCGHDRRGPAVAGPASVRAGTALAAVRARMSVRSSGEAAGHRASTSRRRSSGVGPDSAKQLARPGFFLAVGPRLGKSARRGQEPPRGSKANRRWLP